MIELENHHFAIPKGIIDSTKDHQWTIEERLIGNQIYLVSKYYLLQPPPLVGENMWGIRLCGINPRSVLVYKSKIARHYMPLDEMQYKVHSTTYKIFSSKTFHPNLVKPLDTLPNYRKYSR